MTSIRQLRYFVEIAEAGSFSAAGALARKLLDALRSPPDTHGM
ncbi:MULTISPECIES: LysR family transcriptional regulator [unclassified Pseudomonas]